MNIRKLTKRLAVAAAATAVAGGGVVGIPRPAVAAPTTTLVYSIDGGTTWTTDATIPAGSTVLVRAYYDNDTATDVTDGQVSTSLPSGFTLVSGSTQVCLNPGTTDPTAPSGELKCNTSAGMGGAIDESGVWSGGTLTIAPNAGLYGVPTDATSGLMAAGSPRYLNLHQCTYYGSSTDALLYVVPDTPNLNAFSSGTSTSNTAATSPNCGPGSGGYPYQPANSGVVALDLLGNRYVNLHQCNYYGSAADSVVYVVPDTPNLDTFSAGTNASNTANPSANCGPGSGAWTSQPVNSGAVPLDLIGSRYLNLHQCNYYSSGQDSLTYVVPDTPNANVWSAGTSTSNTAATSPSCGPGAGGYPYQPSNSGVVALDTLDTGRGQGFVQFAMVAPTPATTTTYPQDASVTGTGTGGPTDTGSLTVEAFQISSVGSWPLAIGMAAMGAGGFALIRRRHSASVA